MIITEDTTSHYDFRLDNAAKIFPGMLSPRRTTIFRLAATIDEAVILPRLQQAYETVLERTPYFRVELRKGLFWYYFEPSTVRPTVEGESRFPCMYIPFKRRGVLPLRLIAYRNRIAFEVSHILTDGSGALAFLNGVLLEYFRLRGETIPGDTLPIDPERPVDPEEYEDSFLRQYLKGIPPAPRQSPALRLGGTAVPPPAFFVVEGIVPSDALREESRTHGVTIGEFLTALLIDSIREEMVVRSLKPRPIRISVPMNLRQFFPSRTMRNFVLSVEPGIDPRLGDFSFEDVLKKVHHFMKTELDHRFIRRQIVRNLQSERNPFVRIVPALIKDPILRWAYAAFGTRIFTVGFSNLGRVSVPPEMEAFVESYHFIPPPHDNAINATSIAFRGKTHIVFASTLEDTTLERRYFSRLRRFGVPVSVRTNRR